MDYCVPPTLDGIIRDYLNRSPYEMLDLKYQEIFQRADFSFGDKFEENQDFAIGELKKFSLI